MHLCLYRHSVDFKSILNYKRLSTWFCSTWVESGFLSFLTGQSNIARLFNIYIYIYTKNVLVSECFLFAFCFGEYYNSAVEEQWRSSGGLLQL